jgi:hypothetical protein
VKAAWWFRVAAVVLVLFAMGHTVGFLTFRPPTEEGRGVWDSMQSVHFSVGRQTFSYGGFYVGFGLSVTAFNLFQSLVAWMLARTIRKGGLRSEDFALGWALVVLQVFGAVLSVKYFAIAPTVMSLLAAAILAAGVMQAPRWERVASGA